MSRIKITVYGRVQGVGFRYHTRQKAQELDLTGYVTNKPDRTVEIVADGSERQLQSLVAWTQTGPVRANVQRIDVEDCLPINRFDEFVIE
ncbi:acylphosphatase [Leptolyngbya cf. ectocarpi LEGE 11479]|uniref:acylphosphatase n=1 Tax=Leptolyngbya cf. ectocarpi LEGE 11479 TaxID=1828722 RepID=A0A928ZR13_LEPEC|nr:acylphosphatase [Leptolyngbya ectocarpi]MBE9066835.1 acylphosphatase [Leptolyngbya cf. ectocarpi LEGE 11479]